METIEKPFSKMPVSTRFWLLWLLLFIATAFASLISSLVIMNMTGIKSLEGLSILSDLSNPDVVFVLKMTQLISAVGAFIIPAHIFATLSSTNYRGYLNLTAANRNNQYVLAIVCMISALPLVNWLATINSSLHLPDALQSVEAWMRKSEKEAEQVTEAFLRMSGFKDLGLNIFIIGFIAAFAEELFFRGALQKVLKEWTKSEHAAVWISSALFSALHMQFLGFVPRLLLGVMLGYMKEWSGSLWVPILAHFVNNAGAVLLSFLIQKAIISDTTEDLGASGNDWIFVVLSGILLSALLFYFFKNRLKPQTTL
ncbi:MAG: CPBP family intramembrane metalloprotease [Bacteroidetes bacterium]|nr:CPBP family intramembrane metalloprotease [Bacteroidota bacterium]